MKVIIRYCSANNLQYQLLLTADVFCFRRLKYSLTIIIFHSLKGARSYTFISINDLNLKKGKVSDHEIL